MIRLHLFISGNVQGVNFRHYARQKAVEFGVTGWVRNTVDGKVEVVAEGESSGIQQFLGWCRKGPEMATVEKVTVAEEEYRGEFTGFVVRY